MSAHDARATMLARAFYHDPIISWVISEDDHRVGVYATCLDLLIAATEARGQVVADDAGAVLQLWHTVSEGADPGLLDAEDIERMRRVRVAGGSARRRYGPAAPH